MSEMVERVARAICATRCVRAQVFNECCLDETTRLIGPCKANMAQLLLLGPIQTARAAIAAMREPTDAMCRAGNSKAFITDGSTEDVWQAMIDAALK